jgi:hypothetical protein
MRNLSLKYWGGPRRVRTLTDLRRIGFARVAGRLRIPVNQAVVMVLLMVRHNLAQQVTADLHGVWLWRRDRWRLGSWHRLQSASSF